MWGMSHLTLSLMNRLHKTESAIFKLWMLCSQRMSFQIIQNSQQLSLCCVAALKGLPVHRYSVIFYIFLSFGTVGLNTFIWEQSSTQPGARRREGCCIWHYLSWKDSIKPSLLFWMLCFQRISFQIIYNQHHRWFCSDISPKTLKDKKQTK